MGGGRVRGDHNSHEKLWRGGVVAAGAVFSEAIADQLLVFLFVGVPLPDQPGDFLLEVLDLLEQLVLLGLQDVPLLDPLEAAGLGVASVLEGPPLLLQPDHFFLADAAQLPVELPHRHGHQLLVGEAVVEMQAVVRVVEPPAAAAAASASPRPPSPLWPRPLRSPALLLLDGRGCGRASSAAGGGAAAAAAPPSRDPPRRPPTQRAPPSRSAAKDWPGFLCRRGVQGRSPPRPVQGRTLTMLIGEI